MYTAQYKSELKLMWVRKNRNAQLHIKWSYFELQLIYLTDKRTVSIMLSDSGADLHTMSTYNKDMSMQTPP
jgi:hypothetical protein